MTLEIGNGDGRGALLAALPKWRLDDRTVACLWMSLRDSERVQDLRLNGLNIGEYGTQAMYWDMAYAIRELNLQGMLFDEREKYILPMDDLRWFIKDSRKINWIFSKLKGMDNLRQLICPAKLNQEDALISTIDAWQAPISEKRHALDRLKEDWNQHTDLDRYYSWFKERDEKKRCEAAWIWYREEHEHYLRTTQKFINLNDILFFLDTLSFSPEARLLHVVEIRKKFKSQQVKANLKGKRQSNFALPEEVRDQLDNLAGRYDMTKRKIIERLIRHAHEHGMPRAPSESESTG
ncbi:hypothetical protein [Paraburkholderia sediminicola]|uniref:hypothetical protein n=1 Tax=Paraburkholderia sediminicola TaxID=458836 RepID=UPI0038BA946F